MGILNIPKKMSMHKVLRSVLDFVSAVVIVIILYVIVAMVSSSIPVNTNQPDPPGDYEIYIRSNGVHTDIVMPVENDLVNWLDLVDPAHTKAGMMNLKYVAFGWGDLEFYENTPEWNDLSPGVAFKALFLDAPAAMHVKFKHYVIKDEHTIPIKVTREQYLALADYISGSFALDENGAAQNIRGLHYDMNDTFYHAHGSLNMLNTCNTWTNKALKESGLRASLWTPFTEGLFYSYSRY